MVSLPLFPLPVVLFPGTRMPLQIFEPRYLRMVSDAFKQGQGFVIVQTRQDEEAVDGQTPFYDVGGYGEIVDFSPLPNDRLGIVVQGLRRVRIGEVQAEADNLLMGRCDWLADEQAEAVPPRFEPLQMLLREMLKHPALKPLAGEEEICNAVSLGFRLADWLPFSADDKQELLACEDPGRRLQLINDSIDWDD
ncbi:ATP-dependent protease [Marinobacterium nitratireducens]|uniref:ATP-dependent protease n=1 Tax=Marinobacterium nitratireducens TaxID=518897 RepID=A0A917ZDM9_9GAMM|nr:LON peptidase substrate-binding domain-containing protein [Marinobacterium nitratireducens]GGO80866.1 ATP-dependent protease [Marinobacterium nitratireducens]